MTIYSRANTRLDEPAGLDVDRETVEFGRGVVPTADKGKIFLFVYEEDVGGAVVSDDLTPVSLCEWGA